MPLMQKPVTPPRNAVVDERAKINTEMVSGLEEGVRDTFLDSRPYLKFAFANPYNLSLLFGGLAAAGITLNPLLAMIVLGLEGLWLLHAPESKRLQHILWDPRFQRLREAIEEQKRFDRTRNLSPEQRARIDGLVARQKEIQRLAGLNPSFTSDLLKAELLKTDRLVDAFVDMAITCDRYEHYLDSIDPKALEADRQRWETKLKTGKPGDAQTDIAKKNFAIILKRLDKLHEINDFLNVARGQLDLIENSFQLIGDQIVTMQSPQELSGQLDELLDGVESIRQTAADTETMLNTLGIK